MTPQTCRPEAPIKLGINLSHGGMIEFSGTNFKMKIKKPIYATNTNLKNNLNFSGENINTGATIKKLITSPVLIQSISSFELSYIRKSSLFSFSNPDTISIDKVKFTILNENNKIYSSCIRETVLTNGIQKNISMLPFDC